MHRFWTPVIRPLFDLLQPQTIVEIGVYKGDHTQKILQYCREHRAVLHGIDPAPECDTDVWASESDGAFVFHKGLSLNALLDINDIDIALIDGDHNWYTVYHELALLEKQNAGRQPPVVVLHDTDWPYARRDLYTDPSRIPPAYQQPHAKQGIVPGQHELAESGGLNYNYYNAIYEHGLRNGVLSAVEDFIQYSNHDWQLVQLHGLNGLSILLPANVAQQAGVQAFIARTTTGDIAAAVSTITELDRMNMYVRMVNTEKDAAEQLRTQETSRLYTKVEGLESQLGQEHRSRKQQEAVWSIEKKQLKRDRQQLENELFSLRENRTRISDQLHTLQAAQQVLQRKHTDDITELTSRYQMADSERQQALLRERDLRIQLQSIQTDLRRITHSKSWLWTLPIRRIEACIRALFSKNWLYSLLGHLRRLWQEAGEPCPGFVRWVRHRLLGRVVPAKAPATTSPPVIQQAIAPQPTTQATTPAELPFALAKRPEAVPTHAETTVVPHEVSSIDTVSVVIPCHNYAHYLADALESVLAQTISPKEIIVVDDASDDDPKAVVEQYADRGVRYIRGEWRSVGAARNAGLAETTAAYLVFLDADNMLHPEYLRSGLRALQAQPDAAIAYADQQCFGNSRDFYRFPETFHQTLFDIQNHMDTVSMVRRDALLQAGGWSHGVQQDGDWITWRRILRLGWKATKSTGLVLYRKHDNNMFLSLQKNQTYAERAGLLEEPATLCLSLSGRNWMWPLTTAFLEKQTYPHDQLHLIILDTSQDSAFSAEVRRWLSTCDYAETTYITDTVGQKGLADLPRTTVARDVSHACARIYNRFAALVDTTLCFFLEDDVIPPINAYPRLIQHFAPSVLCAAANYVDKQHHKPVGWKTKLTEFSLDDMKDNGTDPVFGTGLGCLVIRSAYLRAHAFRSPDDLSFDYDFFARAQQDFLLPTAMAADPIRHYKRQWQVLLDWSIRCRHYIDQQSWV